MTKTTEASKYMLYGFTALFPFMIYPWGKNYYYANAKAYYFLAFMIVISFACVFASKNKKISIRNLTFSEWALLFYFLLIGFSSIYSVKMSLIGNLTEHQGIFMMLSYGVLFNYAFRWVTPKQQRVCLHLIAISSFFLAIYGILQHFHLGFLPQDFRMKAWTRSWSLFDNPDYFGSYLVLVMLVTMTLFILTNDKRWEKVYFIILCTQFIALLESETRSAWLGTLLGFSILICLVIRKRKNLWRKWGIIVLAFALLFGVMTATSSYSSQSSSHSSHSSHSTHFSRQNYVTRAVSISNDVQKIVTNKDSGAAGASRWYIWKASLPIIEHYFWFGSGPNTFQIVFQPEHDREFEKYVGKSPIYDENNDYLQIALTTGVPSLVMYLLFIGTILYQGFKIAGKMDEENRILIYGLIAAIIGYLVQSFFNISVVSVAPYFWMFLGFVSSQQWLSPYRSL